MRRPSLVPTLLLVALAGCGGGACPAPSTPAAPAAPLAARALVLEDSPGPQAVGEPGWLVSGGARDAYYVHRDTDAGRPAWVLEPFRDTFGKYGTWMRQIDAGDLRGKRVRVTATVRTQGATRRADFWARAQARTSPSDGLGLSGDSQVLPADADWSQRAIVLDVPPEAAWLEYGVGLAGPGRVWLESARLEVVGPDVPVTRATPVRPAPPPARAAVPAWSFSCDPASDYEAGVDESVKHAGHAAGRLRSIVPAPTGHATLDQRLAPEAYRGKRLRMRAFVKTQVLTGWAGLWMRVDAPSPGSEHPQWIEFDNMEERPLHGTSDWARHEVVLDVAPDASGVAFGVLLHGGGQVWIDDVSFDVVDAKVKTTGRKQPPRGHGDNLDFER